MDRRTLTKLIAVTVLVLGYIMIAAFGFHQEIIAPIIVVAIVVVLFVPFGAGKTRAPRQNRCRRTLAQADAEVGGPTRMRDQSCD